MAVESAEGRVGCRLRRVNAVVFDCDSTLSRVEGIDELAREHRAEIGRLTDRAMRGEIPLEHVYGRRLELVKPSYAELRGLARRYIDELVPDAAEVVRALRAEKIRVRIMSGGLRPALLELGAELGLPEHDVAAVDLHFHANGDYAGFDESSPLARAGGKRDLLRDWRRELAGPVMMVGDGATDLEARDVADVFVAYAGVIDRPAVTSAADVVVRSHSMAPVFVLALAGDKPRHSEFQSLYERGRALLEDEYLPCLRVPKS